MEYVSGAHALLHCFMLCLFFRKEQRVICLMSPILHQWSNFNIAPGLFIMETVCLMHKKHYSTIFSTDIRRTRHSCLIRLPIPHSTLIKKSIIYDSRKIFNHLPLNIRQIRNYNKFRSSTKKMLLSLGFYDVDDYFEHRF